MTKFVVQQRIWRFTNLAANVPRGMIGAIELASGQLTHEIRQVMFVVMAIAIGGVVLAVLAVLIGVVRVIGAGK